MAEFSKNESLLFTAFVLAIIIVSAVLLFFVLLSKAPESYTELYFLPDSTPEKASVEDVIDVKFFVENHEGSGMDYTYAILLNSNALKSGSFSLENEGKKELSESILLSNAGENQKISVELKNAQQQKYSISFWIDVEAGQ